MKPRLLIFIVAYHAESTVESVLARIPQDLCQMLDVRVLLIDDASSDRTFDIGLAVSKKGNLPFPLTVLFNPVNQGYGGNQKIGYHYAIEKGFDYVALLHGDGQYAPEILPQLMRPLLDSEADAVFGSRMLVPGTARLGGMPLYKFLGNKILTWYENTMLGTQFSEFHSGYRIYSVKGLSKIPFEKNSNDFHFDTEIIIQHVFNGLQIKELPIPTYYGDEICRVNGIKYAMNVSIAVLVARLQKMGLFFDPKFDFAQGHDQYQEKSSFKSPHNFCLNMIPAGSRVLDIGCAGGYVGSSLAKLLGCEVTGVDYFDPHENHSLACFIKHDLNQGLPNLDYSQFDYILLLDVIEHLYQPEKFIEDLYQKVGASPSIKVIASTGNIAFGIQRLMLLLGQFNYGRRGILDSTHTRLFTFASFRRLFTQARFEVLDVRGIPAPFPLALKSKILSHFLLWLNNMLIKINKGFFSYQMFYVLQAKPSVSFLLQESIHHSESRAAQDL